MKSQYVLRTVAADGKSHGGFKWPKRGKVAAPDWDPTPECGNGLHGALWGEGDGRLFDWDEGALWQVVKVDGPLVDLGGKVKFEKGFVVHTGDRQTATDRIVELGGRGAVIGAMVTKGDYGTAIAGYGGTATAGYEGTATAGDEGTATAGYQGTATAGNFGTATAGYRGTATVGDGGTATVGNGGTATVGVYGAATAGNFGTATAGNRGTATVGVYGAATAGYRGTATAGNLGTATAGDRGTATAGDEGTATAGNFGTATTGTKGTAIAGDEGTATAGNGGAIIIEYWANGRHRKLIGYIGEDGLKEDTPYRIEDGKFVEVSE